MAIRQPLPAFTTELVSVLSATPARVPAHRALILSQDLSHWLSVSQAQHRRTCPESVSDPGEPLWRLTFKLSSADILGELGEFSGTVSGLDGLDGRSIVDCVSASGLEFILHALVRHVALIL